MDVKRCSTVVPWKKTARRIMFLSDFEQYLNWNVGAIAFFSANSEFPPERAVGELEIAFRKALVYYDYLAGRLRLNSEEGRIEIDCNSAGAGFVVISSELTLAEVGDLVSSSPAFQQLETMIPDKCLFAIQVTSFKCGGFAIAIRMKHLIFDAWGLRMFLNDLTSLIANDHLSVAPYNDRQPLSITPPSHLPHLRGLKVLESDKTFQVSKPASKIFRLGPEDILNLKKKAIPQENSKDYTGGPITRYKVITALIWRCKALARNAGNDPERNSTLHCPVNIRPKLQHPQLPPSYTGNAFIVATCTATFQELEEQPFSELVEMVSNALSNIKEDDIRGIIESGQWLKGFPHGDVVVTSWLNMAFGDVEYPWGKPKWAGPLPVSEWNDIIVVFPENNPSSNGVNVLVTLTPEEMDKFQALFHMFIEKL
ncbi:hypothetical protein IFM89_004090 [Coptis chinensis]|uniref:Uncharacterized protein n=1 Tax=Coptis chinensis TaxID=261450 RepID=A0A835M8Y9_9MAGN|nr:hypothetical protein IFM89_004090 [Coptis chinensis]